MKKALIVYWPAIASTRIKQNSLLVRYRGCCQRYRSNQSNAVVSGNSTGIHLGDVLIIKLTIHLIHSNSIRVFLIY